VSAQDRRLWLVRHGDTEGQSSIRYHGSNDVRLSDAGRAQIRALAPLLRGVDFVRVVHSPLLRAAESAAILAALCGVPAGRVVADARWRELCFGRCEGMTAAEIEAAFPEFCRTHRAGTGEDFPGGEARAAFRARVEAAVLELAGSPWHGDALVVAHRGTVRHALRTLLRVGPGPDQLGVELASVTVVRDDGSWQLEALGLLP